MAANEMPVLPEVASRIGAPGSNPPLAYARRSM